MNISSRFSRRHFLKSTVAASAAAPFILPSHIWSAETPPSGRLLMGCIGVGTQGRGLLGGFLGNKDVQVIADVSGPSKPCDLPEEAMEPGLDWDFWLGPAPKRAYHSALSPRRNPDPQKVVKFVYANGVVLEHGNSGGVLFIGDAEANTWINRQNREPWKLPA